MCDWFCSWFSSSSTSNSREQWSSEMEQESFTFEWRLRNIVEFLKFQDSIESPIFIGGPSSRHQWRLSISQQSSVAGEDMFKISLELVKLYKSKSHVTREKSQDQTAGKSSSSSSSNLLSNSNLNSNGSIKAYVQISCVGPCETLDVCTAAHATDLKEGRQISKVLPKFRIFNLASGLCCCFRRERTLTVRCRITLAGRVMHTMRDESGKIRVMGEEERNDQMKTSDGLKNLSASWSGVFKSGIYSDVTIACRNRSFNVHKIVLAAQSPVFAAMFLSKMCESVENLIEIEDFDAVTVKHFLEFMYTGKSNISSMEENAVELLRIADKYEILALKDDCERMILGNLTAKNAMEILILAHFHSPINLKRKITPFFRKFKKEIQRTDTFKKISKDNPGILDEFKLLIE